MANNAHLCPKYYGTECYAYFNRLFNDIRYYLFPYKYENIKFDNEHKSVNKFKDNINKIDDPILKHIAIYLIANYAEAQEYFSNDGKWIHNPACDLLNKWLDNKKSYFTHALHCKGNIHLWNKVIEPLWEELLKKSKKEYLINTENNKNDNNNNKWCERNNYFRGNLELPKELTTPKCYKHIPRGYECVLPLPPNMCNLANTCKNDHVKNYYKKCISKIKKNGDSDYTSMFDKSIANGNSLFMRISDITFSRQVKENCECSSFEYATPISFTPLGSKLLYRGINKKRLRDNFNEELEYEEYASSINKNPKRGRRRNNIYYHSVRNL